MTKTIGTTRRTERGSALIYILIAIALLALLTVTFMEPSSQQTQSQNSFKMVSEIQSQAEFIRSAVQECVMLYPGGDATIDISGGGTDPGADRRYPINPMSDHFDTATVTQAADRTVKNLRCPGNPGDQPGETVASPGNAVNHIGMFGSSTGKFVPPPPDLFSEWSWYNGTDGVFFWIETDKTDSFIQTALQKLDEVFAKCEADIIDATASAVDLDSDQSVECANGKTCFRVWMIMRDASAVFPDEAGCP